VNTEGDHLYMEPGEKPVMEDDDETETGIGAGRRRDSTTGWNFGAARKLGQGMTPLLGGFRKKKGMRPASALGTEVELEPASPAAAMYAKLAKRRSML